LQAAGNGCKLQTSPRSRQLITPLPAFCFHTLHAQNGTEVGQVMEKISLRLRLRL